jgi:hypothetical protein
VHLKDNATGTPVWHEEAKATPQTFKEVGAGALDFPAILKAAAAGGVSTISWSRIRLPAILWPASNKVMTTCGLCKHKL